MRKIIEEMKKVAKYLEKYSKLIRLIVVGLLIVLVVLLFLIPLLKKSVTPSEEFETANKIMFEKTKGGINDNWYGQKYARDIMSQEEQLVYVDLDSANPKVVIGRDEVFFERKTNNYNIVEAKDDENKEKLGKILKDKFKIADENEDYNSIANSIGTLTKYTDTIARIKNIDRCDRILSMIYNTVVGDEEGHIAVYLKDNKLTIKRAKDIDAFKIDVKRFVAIMQDIEQGKANTTDKNLLQILIEKRVLDTNALLNVAYYDVRHDCVIGSKGKICKQQDDKEKYQKLVAKLKDNPEKVYIYMDERDSLVELSDSLLCNDSTMYVYVDLEALQSATIKEPNEKVYNGLMLVIGLVIGLVAYPLIRRKSKKQNTHLPPTDENNESLPVETVIEQYKQSEEFQKIKSDAGQYLSMRRSAQEFQSKANEYKNEADKYKNDYERFQDLRKCKNEADLITTLSQYGMMKIHSFQQVKDKEFSLEDVVGLYDKQTNHKLLHELKEIENKAKWYDENKDIVVASVDKFRQTIKGSQRRDRAFFFETVMNVLSMPILGDNYKFNIENALKDDRRIEQESRAYNLLIATKENYTVERMISDLTREIGDENARWITAVREAASRYTNIRNFTDIMWEKYVKEFVKKEPGLTYDSSPADKGWYFEMLMNIAYHTVDNIRSIKDNSDNIIFCYNKTLMDNNFNFKGTKEFAYNNINLSTSHTNTIYEWAKELGVEKLEIVVDNYAIMPKK